MPTLLERMRELRQEETSRREEPFFVDNDPLALHAIPAIIADLPKPPEYSQAAADVLGLLVRSEVPMNHTALVNALAEKGYTKRQARAAIAECQVQRWIGHNLTTGYELQQ